MSRKTESTDTAITVPSIWVPPSSLLRAWLRSNCESKPPNDSLDSEVAWDSGMLRLDMTDNLRCGVTTKITSARTSHLISGTGEGADGDIRLWRTDAMGRGLPAKPRVLA